MSELDYLWDPHAPRDSGIAELEAVLAPARYAHGPTPRFATKPKTRGARLLVAAALVLVAGSYYTWFSANSAWTVRPVAGATTIAGRILSNADTLGTGQSLVTDHSGEALLSIGRIGRARIGGASRVTLVRSHRGEHRLALVGEMWARVWAPPRLFFVETGSSLATDLGCAYHLHVDAAGNGILDVESGEVELAFAGIVSRVPAGASARLRAGQSPGVPFLRTAPVAFRSALDAYEHAATRAQLDDMLATADSTSLISLWHLLSRVAAADRGAVFDRLAALAPPPAEVTRAGIVQLDHSMLQSWRDRLESAWSTETIPYWKRAWRTLWSWLNG